MKPVIATLLALTAFTFATPAEAEPIRIVAFGTSATYGRYLPRGEDYPSKLEAALRSKGIDVRVTNAGKIGDFAVDALARVDAAVPKGTHLVIVEFGVNEIKLRNEDPASVRTAVGRLVDKVRPRAATVLLVDYMHLDLTSVARSRGIQALRWGGVGLGSDPRYAIPSDRLQHLNGAGYDITVARMLPAIEAAVRKVRR